MSAIDPNKISMVKFKGSTLPGNVISVGVDGIYNYDYNHPQTAYNNAGNGDIILIYPGTYNSLGGYTTLYLTKDIHIYIVGMGNSPDNVVLHTPYDIWHGIVVEPSNPTNTFVVVENLKIIQDRAWGGTVVHRKCSASTVVLLNKLYLYDPSSGYVVSYGESDGTVDYMGDSYITNCTFVAGWADLRRVGRGSSTSIISVQKSYHAGTGYTCYDCARNPSPFDYVSSNTTGYGSSYGSSFFEFITIPTYNILYGTSSNYNAVWADPTANINSGKFYVSTTGSGAALSVINLQTKILNDNYSVIVKGGGNEYLNSEDIEDINISII